MGEEIVSLSVCNLLLRFGSGRFDSSTPIWLLWHSSPLNRIDYWFCSLRLVWDFPSGSLCSKRNAAEKHKSLCVPPHNAASHIQIEEGGMHEKSCCCSDILLRRLRVVMVLMLKIKSKPLMRCIDLNESGVISECTCCFCIDLTSQKKTRWACLIIDRGGAEKNSLFIFRVKYWVMTSHPQVPIIRLFTCSALHKWRNWSVRIFRLYFCFCHWFFVPSLFFTHTFDKC